MKRSSLPRSSRGYTIIELLVAFSIMAILSTVGFAGFSNYNQIQQLNQSATNVELLVSLARSNAISVVTTASNENGDRIECIPPRKLFSYKITQAANGTLKLIMVCYDESGALSDVENELKQVRFTSSSLTIETPSTDPNTCTLIEFEPLSAKAIVQPNAALPGGTYCYYKINRGSKSKEVRVDNNGNTSLN